MYLAINEAKAHHTSSGADVETYEYEREIKIIFSIVWVDLLDIEAI